MHNKDEIGKIVSAIIVSSAAKLVGVCAVKMVKWESNN